MNTLIYTSKFFLKALSSYRKNKKIKYLHKWKGIEAVIEHLKEDFHFSQDYYKGIMGDGVKVMFAATGFNFKRMTNKWKSFFGSFLKRQLDQTRKMYFIN